MIIHDTLARLGIDGRHTDVYLALVRQGPASIRDIAVTAGINRGTTYEILKRLRDKGLARDTAPDRPAPRYPRRRPSV